MVGPLEVLTSLKSSSMLKSTAITGWSKPPIATENVLENTVMGRSTQTTVFSWSGILVLSIYADACCIDAVICFKRPFKFTKVADTEAPTVLHVTTPPQPCCTTRYPTCICSSWTMMGVPPPP